MWFWLKIEEWFRMQNPHVKRIHLSHTDMDGYGCQVVSQVARCMYALKGVGTEPIIYRNMGYDPKSQKEAIDSAVAEAIVSESFEKGENILSFLVTDIARFNPEKAFADLMAAGYLVHWLVLDHHQDTDGLRSLSDKTIHLPESDIDMITGILIDQNQSATLELYQQAVEHLIKEGNINLPSHSDLAPFRVSEQLEDMDDVLYDLCWHTSLSDTGNLGKWADNIDPDWCAVKQLRYRLFFEWYWDMKNADQWVMDWVQRCIAGTQLCPSTIFANYHDKRFHDRHLEYWHKLIDCYQMSLNALKPYNGTFDLATSRLGAKYAVFELTPDPNIYMGKLFSPVSTELLRNRPDIEILAIHYPDTKVISLRTAKDYVNVAEIAAKFGGGGHPKASGFHYE